MQYLQTILLYTSNWYALMSYWTLVVFWFVTIYLLYSCSKFLYIFNAWYYDTYIDACPTGVYLLLWCNTPFYEHHLEIKYKCLEDVCYFGWGPANFRSCLLAFNDREATQTEPLNRIWDGGRAYSWVIRGFLVSHPNKLPGLLFVPDAGSVRPTHGTSSATTGDFWVLGKWVK